MRQSEEILTFPIQGFGQTQDVAITALVDNLADVCLPGSDTVIRYDLIHGEPLLAEHGLAMLVDLKQAGRRILWDAGYTRLTLPENLRRMRIDPHSINAMALSHGHNDHYMAVTEVLHMIAGSNQAPTWPGDVTRDQIVRWDKGRRVPLITHPAAFSERWSIMKDGSKYGPWTAPRAEWEAAHADIILSEGPYQLAPGCWLTGTVPRHSFEKIGTPPTDVCPQGDDWVHDMVLDDQAMVINIRDKGLVILTGCAHAGIVNTVNYARQITGVDRVWGVIGGYHLVGAKNEEIQRTVEEIKQLGPRIVVPTHCTGFKAQMQFASQMPDEFVMGSVGTTYLF
jgi:7,8-dihydropterin-6-yl-methyl-4-(beta-D-ribofuranosyl)aminobenzene 5'-phosphate synthase